MRKRLHASSVGPPSLQLGKGDTIIASKCAQTAITPALSVRWHI